MLFDPAPLLFALPLQPYCMGVVVCAFRFAIVENHVVEYLRCYTQLRKLFNYKTIKHFKSNCKEDKYLYNSLEHLSPESVQEADPR